MITTRDIVVGVLLPALVSGLVVFIGRLLGGRAARAAASLGVGIGFVVAYGALFGVPSIQPLDSIDWLFFAAIVAGALGAIDAWFWTSTRVRWRFLARALVVVALSVSLVWLLARHLLVFEWIGWRGPVHIGLIALMMTLVWAFTDLLHRRSGAFSLNLTLACVTGIASAAIAMSGTIRFGQIGGILFATLAAVATLGILFFRNPTPPGAALVFSALYVGLVSASSQLFLIYGGLAHLNAALLLLAPVCAWLGELVPSRNATVRASARLVAALLPATVAATLAAIEFARLQSESAT